MAGIGTFRVRAPFTRRLRTAALAVSLLACGTAAQAQTLADMLTAVERAAQRAQLRTRDTAAQRVLDSLTALLRASGATTLTTAELRDITLGRRPRFGTIARWHQARYTAAGLASVDSAIAGVRQIANVHIVPLLPLSTADVDALLKPLDDLGSEVRNAAQLVAEDRLRRYEIKYGPDSPRLNGAEVLANYAGQLVFPCTKLWPFPCLGVREDGGPSPYEIVIGYRTTDLTASDDGSGGFRPRIVSTGQLGLRLYDFGEGAGEGGRLARLRRPTHRAFGLFLMPPRDAPLISPLAARNRVGGFLGWGGLHLGYVGGQRERLVFGTGMQILPYLF